MGELPLLPGVKDMVAWFGVEVAAVTPVGAEGTVGTASVVVETMEPVLVP